MTSKYFIMIGSIIYVYLVTLNFVVSQEGSQPIYSLRMLIFKNDTVELKDIHAETGTISYFPVTETGYTIRVVSFDNKELFGANLGVSFIIVFESVESIETDSMVVHVRVPVFDSAKWITIHHLNKEILRIDLSEHFCNKDGFCDLGENRYICFEDCEKYIKPKERGSQILYVIIPSLAILIAIAIILFRRRK